MEVLTARRDRKGLEWPSERGGERFGSHTRAAPLRIAMLTPPWLSPSRSTSGETLTIEESMTLRARTETAGHVGVDYEWSWASG
jgi:hypothetical protein